MEQGFEGREVEVGEGIRVRVAGRVEGAGLAGDVRIEAGSGSLSFSVDEDGAEDLADLLLDYADAARRHRAFGAKRQAE